MTYEQVISVLKEGVVAKRPHWDAQSFIRLVEGKIQDRSGNPYPQQQHLQDLKANDWVAVVNSVDKVVENTSTPSTPNTSKGASMSYKLGKLAPKVNAKTLMFSKYLTGALPSPATKVYREYKTPDAAKLMYGNDSIGDCTCAAVANFIILTTVHTGTVVIPPVQDVISLYSSVSGYDPTTGANDNGAAMTDVLEKLQTVGLSGHKILAWAQIDHTNLTHRQLGVDLFGATYVGVNLPVSAQEQFGSGQPWEVVNSSIEGGHAILHPGYGSLGDDYVSWARWDQKASAAWSKAYIEEEYVIITTDWFNQVTQKTPGGIDLATLESDLKLISA